MFSLGAHGHRTQQELLGVCKGNGFSKMKTWQVQQERDWAARCNKSCKGQEFPSGSGCNSSSGVSTAQVTLHRLSTHCSPGPSHPFPAGSSSRLFPGTTNLPNQWSSFPACSSVWPSFWLFLLLQPAEKSIQQSDPPSASFPGEEKGEQEELVKLNLKSPLGNANKGMYKTHRRVSQSTIFCCRFCF